MIRFNDEITLITSYSESLGLGHLSRSLVLCEYFFNKNHVVNLIIKNQLPFFLKKNIKYNLFIENSNEDIIRKIKFLKKTRIVVLDSYEYSFEFEKKIKMFIPKVITIDDNTREKYFCDILIDPNLGSTPEKYINKVSNKTCILTGGDYSIISQKFFRKRKKPLAILISMGGTDPKKLTFFVMNSLFSLRKKEKFIIVLGSKKDYTFPLRKVLKKFSNCSVHIEEKEIEKLYSISKVAIGTGGVGLLERIAIGLPSIIISIAINQVSSSQLIIKKNAGVYLGNYLDVNNSLIIRKLSAILKNKFLLTSYEKKCKKLINQSSLDLIYKVIIK